MADYSYTDGDGLAKLDANTPNSATEPVAIAPDAIKQIKAYLKDTVAGPTAGLTATFPVGFMAMFAGSSAPTSWLLCQGQAVSRSTYSALFAVIGTLYGGGDGTTTFNLPDLSGRAPVGGGTASGATGATAKILGSKAGAETITLTESQLPAHTHSITSYTRGMSHGSINQMMSLDPSLVVQTSNTNSTGGGAAITTLPPYTAVNFIIRY